MQLNQTYCRNCKMYSVGKERYTELESTAMQCRKNTRSATVRMKVRCESCICLTRLGKTTFHFLPSLEVGFRRKKSICETKLSLIYCILYPVSCFIFPVSCILHPVSWILVHPVSCILLPETCILRLVSLYPCILFPVSYFLCPLSCILYPESWCILYPASCFQ